MEPEEVNWNDPTHRCYGCKYNAMVWASICSSCYRQVSKPGLSDLYELDVPSYGAHKILPRSVATGIKPKE